MIYIAALRGSYKAGEISTISSLNYPADGLTRCKANGALQGIVSSRKDLCKVERRITREEPSALLKEPGV